MVICNASDGIGFDRRNPDFSNAPLRMEQEVNSREKDRLTRKHQY